MVELPSESSTDSIAVIIPCYKVAAQILGVIAAVPDRVSHIICVDDACPENSGRLVESQCTDTRVRVIYHAVNQGVGGAMVTGYAAAIEAGAAVAVKIDGDGQMDPALIPLFTDPILSGLCDYTKGNRFFRPENLRGMPAIRLIGNGILSFMTKLSTGYWDLFDPTNGYTGARAATLKQIPLEKLSRGYFFESDLLFRLNVVRAVVLDIPMHAVYGDEESSLRISHIIKPFLKGHARNFGKRVFYNYFLRNFSIASLELALGLPLLLFGLIFGIIKWHESNVTGVAASAGTVMLSALPVLLGLQMIMSFLQYDIASTPRTRSRRT
jgi:glycosyltransferase involved in cell wall biosynthesis